MPIEPYGPSGECEGQPCYTASDEAQTEAALAHAQSEEATAQATYEAKQQATQEWQMQLESVQMNRCP